MAMAQTGRWMVAATILLGLTVFAVVLVALGDMAVAEPDNFSFCHAPSLNPYLEPLEGLPAQREIPATGVLPFAQDVHIRALPGPVVATGEPIGFRLSFRHLAKGERRRKSGIRVMAEVFSMSRGDKTAHLVWRGPERVIFREVPVSTFVTPFIGRTYRMDLVFMRRNGERLAQYGQYFHAGPPRVAGRLAVGRSQVSPGGSVLVRLENAGTKRLPAGYGYRIERFNGESWETDPRLNYGAIPKVLVRLGPTGTFDCFELDVPADQPAGRYRFLKQIRGRSPAIGEFSITSAPE